MKTTITLLAENFRKEKKWVDELSRMLVEDHQIEIQSGREVHGFEKVLDHPEITGQILLVDSEIFEKSKGGAHDFEEWVKKIDRRNRAVFLLVDEKSQESHWMGDGQVDDVLLLPFRYLDVLSKVKHYTQLVQWREVLGLSQSFAELVNHFKEDLQFLERVHKAKLPKRFSDVKGYRISSRYLSGVASGGDYFDLQESRAGHYLSMVLSNSSSYGLSGAVLSILMSAMMKLASDTAGQFGAPTETVRRIYDEVLLTLGPQDHLSLFYGSILRDEQVFQFLNLGTLKAYYADPKSFFRELPKQGEAISRSTKFSPLPEAKVSLSVGGRIALISRGFVEAVGGGEEMQRLLNELRNREALDTLNELAFKVKSQLKTSDDLPAQDCTAMILDTDAQLLKPFS